MATWQDRANRGLVLFEASASEEGDRTWQIFNHVLDENNFDDYISRDFFNVQQTSGGLPPGMRFENFLVQVAGHVRVELEGGSFDETLGDEDFKSAALSFDDVIRQHIRFLNGVTHQIAPGQVHVNLWNFILAVRDEPRSLYTIYRGFLADA